MIFGKEQVGSTLKTAMRFFFLSLFALVLFSSANVALGQKTVDKMVATVKSGARMDLITHSDIIWQIALEPNTSVENPTSEDLNRALQRLINFRLIAQEAEKLPSIVPTEKEIDDEIKRIASFFQPTSEFQRRVNMVGFNSVNDESFRAFIAQRVTIDKYLDFRFRSFVVITPKEEEDYYRNVYVPRFREQHPNRILPTLEEARAEINATLTEDKIESGLNAFLDGARERAEITILNPV
jgi:hypothetical protein